MKTKLESKSMKSSRGLTFVGLMIGAVLIWANPVLAQPTGNGRPPMENGDEELGSPPDAELGDRKSGLKGAERAARGGKPGMFAGRRGGEEHDGSGGHELGGRKGFLERQGKYLETIQDPHGAIGFAALGIRKSYSRQGKPAVAISELEKALATTKDQKARNVLMFVLRQLHESNNDEAKANQLNSQILSENIAKLKE